MKIKVSSRKRILIYAGTCPSCIFLEVLFTNVRWDHPSLEFVNSIPAHIRAYPLATDLFGKVDNACSDD